MKLPGEAWLEFRLEPVAAGEGIVLHQRALFVPRGLAGHLYWWAVWPFHGIVFGAMLRNLIRGPATVVPATEQTVPPAPQPVSS